MHFPCEYKNFLQGLRIDLFSLLRTLSSVKRLKNRLFPGNRGILRVTYRMSSFRQLFLWVTHTVIQQVFSKHLPCAWQ